MKTYAKTCAALLLLLVAGCATTMDEMPATPAAPLAAEQQADIDAVRTWEFGMSREPLVAVEREVVAALGDDEARRSWAASLSALATDTTATYQARDFALRQLVLAGAPENVDALAPLLLDPEYSHMARYALEPMTGEAVDEALLAALPMTEGAVKLGIIDSLAVRGVEEAAEMLGPLTGSPDPAVAAAARNALAKLGAK